MIGCSAASAVWLEMSGHDQLRRFLSDHNLQITARFTRKNDHKDITEKKYQRPCLTLFLSNGFGALTIYMNSKSKNQKLGCRGAAGT